MPGFLDNSAASVQSINFQKTFSFCEFNRLPKGFIWYKIGNVLFSLWVFDISS